MILSKYFSKIGIKINQDFAFSKFMMCGGKSATVFFPGCAFMKLGSGIIYKTLDLLRISEKDIMVCSLCCTYPSSVLDSGYNEKNINKLIDFFTNRKVKKIYVACPNCFSKLNKIFSEYRLDIKVMMMYETISQNLEKKNIQNSNVKEKIVIHDPCKIRNDKRTHNAVRNILDKIGQEYVESEFAKENTLCCGNINMLHLLDIEKSNLMRKKCVDGLLKKSDYICSYCNGCLYAFEKENIRTIHLMELIFGKATSNKFYNRLKFTFQLLC